MKRMVRLMFLDDERLEMGARSCFDLALSVNRSLVVLFDVEGVGAKGIKRNKHLHVLYDSRCMHHVLASLIGNVISYYKL
jgi:hypothetical protein